MKNIALVLNRKLALSSSVCRGSPMRAPPFPLGLHRYMLKACVAQIPLEKSHLNVEKFLRAIGARRGGHGAMPPPPLWPCNKVLKPNFQSIISQTNNDCSLLSFILAKLVLLDISCENIFALSVVTALTACLFSAKKCAKMSVFLCENRKKSLAAGGVTPRPL